MAARSKDLIPTVIVAAALVAVVVWMSVDGCTPVAQTQQTQLIYRVGEDTPVYEAVEAIEAVTARINPNLTLDVTVREVADDRIEILIPGKQPELVEQIERRLVETDVLEFRILADSTISAHAWAIERAGEKPDGPNGSAGDVRAWWVPVRQGEEASFAGYGYDGVVKRNRPEQAGGTLELLVLADRYDVTGRYLSRATSSIDENGNPCVSFSLSEAGAKRFAGLTGANLPDDFGNTRKLGIIVQGELVSAPSIQSTIHDRGQITGSFTYAEVSELADILNSNALLAGLEKVERHDYWE